MDVHVGVRVGSYLNVVLHTAVPVRVLHVQLLPIVAGAYQEMGTS